MSTTPEFAGYICGQLEGLGAVRSRKMFGEYMIYLNDKPVLMVCDDVPYIKTLPCLAQLLDGVQTQPPYEGSKPHYILDPDDRDTLRQAAILAEEVTPVPKKKAPKAKKEPKAKASPKAETGTPAWHIQFPKEHKPDMAEIKTWVDSPLLPELVDWLEETYKTTPSIEYSACGMEPGWNVKYKKGSKALCVIYPRMNGYFVCMVTLGPKLIGELEVMLPTLSPYMQALYARTSFYMDGKWLIIDMKDTEQLIDAQRLILLKATPKK